MGVLSRYDLRRRQYTHTREIHLEHTVLALKRIVGLNRHRPLVISCLSRREMDQEFKRFTSFNNLFNNLSGIKTLS